MQQQAAVSKPPVSSPKASAVRPPPPRPSPPSPPPSSSSASSFTAPIPYPSLIYKPACLFLVAAGGGDGQGGCPAGRGLEAVFLEEEELGRHGRQERRYAPTPDPLPHDAFTIPLTTTMPGSCCKLVFPSQSSELVRPSVLEPTPAFTNLTRPPFPPLRSSHGGRGASCCRHQALDALGPQGPQGGGRAQRRGRRQPGRRTAARTTTAPRVQR